MKTKRRRIANTIIVCALLLSQLIPVASIAVTTEESKSIPVSGTDTTSSTEAPIQSSTSSTFSEQQENKSEINENEVEKNYDERALEENQTNSEHPSVTIEEKKIVDDQLKLKGKIRTPKSATNQSIIEKLVLQSKATDGTWVDKKEFEINSEEALQKNEIDFNFDETTDDTESFRLVIDYEVRHFSNDYLFEINHHKAHFDLTELDQVMKETVSTSESDEVTNDSNQERSATEVEKKIPVEQSDEQSKHAKKNEERESTDDQKNDTSNSHEQNDTIEEKLFGKSEEKNLDNSLNIYSHPILGNTKSLGRAYSETVSYDGVKMGTYGYSLGINYLNITGRTANVSFKNGNQKQISGANSIPAISGNISFVYSDDPNFINSKLTYGSLPGSGITNGDYTYVSKNNFNSIDSSNKVSLTSENSSNVSGDPNFIAGGGTVHKETLTNLLPNKKYFGWFFVDCGEYFATITLQNLEVTGWSSKNVNYIDDNSGFCYPFETKTAVPLSNISTPIFEDSSATVGKMKAGTYLGDISQIENNGVVQVKKASSADTDYESKKTNLIHSLYEGTTTNKGIYNSANILGLTAGTKYKARVGLQKYQEKGYVYSIKAGEFSTRNAPLTPSIPTLNIPTTSDPKATAEFTAKYGASKGNDGDHPEATGEKITIEVTDVNGTLLKTLHPADTSGNGIRLSAAPTVNSNVDNPNINFKLLGLTAKTTYKVRYKVENSAGESLFSEYQTFTTNGLKLDFTSATYDQTRATDSSIRLNQGRYTGDISTKKGDIWYRPANESENSIVKKTGVVIHETRTGTEENPGKYGPTNGYELTELVPGTKYEHWLQFYDSNEIEVRKWSGYFYTANKLNNIPDPIQSVGDTSYSAEASFEVPFEANTTSTSTVARPKDMKVEVQNSDGSWSEVTSDAPQSVPKLKSKSIGNATTKKMTFTISQLKSNKTYKIRVSAHTENVVWTETVEKTFTTKAVALNISSPEVDYRTATPDSIKLKEGNYTGDISDVKGDIANQGGGTSWNRVNGVLEHDTFTGTDNAQGKYGTNTNGYTITGLKPGSNGNFAWVYFKDAENIEKSKRTFFPFVMPNKLNVPESPAVTQGSTLYSGEASFEIPYEAHDISPKELKVTVSSDGGENWIDATENAEAGNPKISTATEGSLGNMSNKRITFTLSQLRANTNYKVKIKSKNREQVYGQDGVTTDTVEVWSNRVEKEFTTQNLPDGYYLDNVPNFDFGTIDASDQEISAGLNRDNDTSNFSMDILNIGMSAWTLSAKMSEMKTNQAEGSVRVLNGARIEFTKKLEKTSDNINWNPVTSGFSGLEDAPNNKVSLPAGSGAIDLFSANQGNDLESQGIFRNVIDFESVKLIVPPNVGEHGKTYTGVINWTLDSLP